MQLVRSLFASEERANVSHWHGFTVFYDLLFIHVSSTTRSVVRSNCVIRVAAYNDVIRLCHTTLAPPPFTVFSHIDSESRRNFARNDRRIVFATDWHRFPSRNDERFRAVKLRYKRGSALSSINSQLVHQLSEFSELG